MDLKIKKTFTLSFPNACVGIKFDWIEFKRALHGLKGLSGGMHLII